MRGARRVRLRRIPGRARRRESTEGSAALAVDRPNPTFPRSQRSFEGDRARGRPRSGFGRRFRAASSTRTVAAGRARGVGNRVEGSMKFYLWSITSGRSPLFMHLPGWLHHPRQLPNLAFSESPVGDSSREQAPKDFKSTAEQTPIRGAFRRAPPPAATTRRTLRSPRRSSRRTEAESREGRARAGDAAARLAASPGWRVGGPRGRRPRAEPDFVGRKPCAGRRNLGSKECLLCPGARMGRIRPLESCLPRVLRATRTRQASVRTHLGAGCSGYLRCSRRTGRTSRMSGVRAHIIAGHGKLALDSNQKTGKALAVAL